MPNLKYKKIHVKSHTVILLFFLTPLLIFFLMTVCNEFFDVPHHLFGDKKTSFTQRKGEIIIECTTFIIMLGILFYSRMKLMRRIKILEGIIPVCSFCHNVRTDEKWVSSEEYIRQHSIADFSHGICPECLEKKYPEHAAEILSKKSNNHTLGKRNTK